MFSLITFRDARLTHLPFRFLSVWLKAICYRRQYAMMVEFLSYDILTFWIPEPIQIVGRILRTESNVQVIDDLTLTSDHFVRAKQWYAHRDLIR